MTDLDPVTLQIIWRRLITVAEECWVTLSRTAFSLIIGESYDFGCALLDAQGEALAHSPRSMPAFNITLPRVTRRLLETYPADTLTPGDVMITNDPWLCAGHLDDLAIITPVFKANTLIAFVGSVAHCSDIGGTRDLLAAREIYEEGLQIPPLKLYRGGVPNVDLHTLLAANVRVSTDVLGDIEAQVAANHVGAGRLLEVMDEYGIDDLEPLASEMHGRSEQEMRDAINALEDGEYRHQITCDAAGEPLTLPVRVVVRGSEIEIDWSEAPAQVARGAVNCTLSYTTAHCLYVLKCLLAPDSPSNAGCFRPISISAREGTVLHCRHPAAVSLRTMVGWFVGPAIMGALASAIPNRVQSFTALPLWVFAYGVDADGYVFNSQLVASGGQGASFHRDGKSALLFPTSAANTSIEVFETRTPLLVTHKGLRPDSGGAGRSRGGLGVRLRLSKLACDDRPALVSFTPHGCLTDPPSGFDTAAAGASVSIRLSDGNTEARDWELNGLAELTSSSQALTFDVGGGAGHGAPHERPLDQLEADLADGVVTAQGLEPYGCELSPDGLLQAVGTRGGREQTL